MLGPALRHRRRAAPHRVPPGARHASPAPRIPASVSTAPVQAMEISLYPAYNTLSKMLSCHPELKRDVMCIGGTSQFPLTMLPRHRPVGRALRLPAARSDGGRDRRVLASATASPPAARCAARSAASATSSTTSRASRSSPCTASENTDSGGAGKYRGGNSAITAFIPHGTTRDRARDGVVRRGHPHGAGPRRRLSRVHERLRVQARHRHPRAGSRARRHARRHRGASAGRTSCSSSARPTSTRGRATSTRSRSRRARATAIRSSAIPEAVRQDVELEDISREAARDIFRVVLVGRRDPTRRSRGDGGPSAPGHRRAAGTRAAARPVAAPARPHRT